jgi:hypothetical protein
MPAQALRALDGGKKDPYALRRRAGLLASMDVERDTLAI